MWRSLPCRGSEEQLFAIGDVHGQSAALAAALQAIADCPGNGRPRHLIFLGDLIDRGPDSLGAVRLAMDGRRLACVDQVTILPGNHELMLLDGLLDPDPYMVNWLDNGGDAVIKEADPGCTARKLSDLADIARSAFDPAFLALMTEGPTWYQSGDLLFVHAGLRPGVDPVTFLKQPRFWAQGAHWAWIREPFLNWRGGWGPERSWIVVHGHTPVLTKRAGLSEFEAVADLISSHRRLSLDAGPAYGVGQVSWAEFGSDRYRLSLTQVNSKPKVPRPIAKPHKSWFFRQKVRAKREGRKMPEPNQYSWLFKGFPSMTVSSTLGWSPDWAANINFWDNSRDVALPQHYAMRMRLTSWKWKDSQIFLESL